VSYLIKSPRRSTIVVIGDMFRAGRISTTAAAALAGATSLALGIGGSGAPSPLSRCSDPMVYDPKIDEIIPEYMVQGLEDAIPPVQPGDKLTHHLRSWQVFC
jgi:hypothetical protein